MFHMDSFTEQIEQWRSLLLRGKAVTIPCDIAGSLRMIPCSAFYRRVKSRKILVVYEGKPSGAIEVSPSKRMASGVIVCPFKMVSCGFPLQVAMMVGQLLERMFPVARPFIRDRVKPPKKRMKQLSDGGGTELRLVPFSAA